MVLMIVLLPVLVMIVALVIVQYLSLWSHIFHRIGPHNYGYLYIWVCLCVYEMNVSQYI